MRLVLLVIFSVEMSLWLLAAASKGVKKVLFLDNKDVNKSSGFSKGGENL